MVLLCLSENQPNARNSKALPAAPASPSVPPPKKKEPTKNKPDPHPWAPCRSPAPLGKHFGATAKAPPGFSRSALVRKRQRRSWSRTHGMAEGEKGPRLGGGSISVLGSTGSPLAERANHRQAAPFPR